MSSGFAEQSAPGHEPSMRRAAPDVYGRRLRSTVSKSLVWMIVGSAAGTLWILPQISFLLRDHGALYWLARGFLPSFVSALSLFLAIGLGADSGSELARRPWRFVALVLIGATVALPAVAAVDWLLPVEHHWPAHRRLLSWWLTITLFGVSFGWASVLNGQRIEARERLALLLGRRSTLDRRLVQARLFAARAQIDPELVARVLRKVREQFHVPEGRTDSLLDQLSVYLRLAMGRVHDRESSVESELILLRAYACLREVEIGERIEVQLPPDDRSISEPRSYTIPLFVLARKLLDAMPPASSCLRMTLKNGVLVAKLDRGARPIADDCIEELNAELRVLFGTSQADILHDFCDTGVHRYVVKTAFG